MLIATFKTVIASSYPTTVFGGFLPKNIDLKGSTRAIAISVKIKTDSAQSLAGPESPDALLIRPITSLGHWRRAAATVILEDGRNLLFVVFQARSPSWMPPLGSLRNRALNQ
jgi:hypothetical protein